MMHYRFDHPGVYAIHVGGKVDERWSSCLGGLTIFGSETDEEEPKTVTVLIGLLTDQAALAGVLDTLYQNRYPLLYIKYLGPPPPTADHERDDPPKLGVDHGSPRHVG